MHTYIHSYIHTYIHMHTYIHTYIRTNIRIPYVCIYTYICMHMYMCICTNTRISSHTMNVFRHIKKQKCKQREKIIYDTTKK